MPAAEVAAWLKDLMLDIADGPWDTTRPLPSCSASRKPVSSSFVPRLHSGEPVPMSSNRDKVEDLRRTKAVMAGGSRLDPAEPKKNWLGHTKGSAKIDDMLLVGATRKQLETARESSGVDGHLQHLQREHGLEVVVQGEVYSFARISNSLHEGESVPSSHASFSQTLGTPSSPPSLPAHRESRHRARVLMRATAKSLLVAAASAIGAQVGGWLGAVAVAILTALLAVLTEPSTE
jgi:hypothetical protein